LLMYSQKFNGNNYVNLRFVNLYTCIDD